MAEEKKSSVERTLAMIKPNAFEKRKEIMDRIQKEGFKIVESYEVTLPTIRAQNFYAEHKGKPFFDELCGFMSSGPIVVLKLEKEGAIKGWRTLMGPTNVDTAKKEAPESIRALYGESMTKNASHGSDAPETAARELAFYFNVQDTFAMIKPNAMGKQDAIVAEIKKNGFELVKSAEVKLSKENAEKFYEEHKGKGFFDELVGFMTSGPIFAMQLRRANAIQGWRNLMGPTNPAKAKSDSPLCLRARYADGFTENATHGSDAVETAERELGLFFGDAGFATKK